MASFQGPYTLAPVGSTGNNTHVGIQSSPDSEYQCAIVKIEATGGTPTLSWKLQGSFNSTTGSDGDWFDLSAILGDAAATAETLTQTKTAVGAYGNFLATHKFVNWVRLVTSANTNVTYSATFVEDDAD